MKNSIILQIEKRVRRIALSLVVGLCLSVVAEDARGELIGVGRVAANGTLENSYSPISASVSVIDVGTGYHRLVFDAVGAFTGTTVDDYHVGITVHRAVAEDEDDIASVNVFSVSDDDLQVDIYTADVEDDTNLIMMEERDVRFNFQVYRIPSGGDVSAASDLVLASGRVDADGSLVSGVNAYGSQIITEQTSTGVYSVRVLGVGQFDADNLVDYSLALSVEGAFGDDNVIHGIAADNASDDEAVFVIYTSDAQSALNDDEAHSANVPFTFVIYRQPSLAEPTSPPATSLLGLLAHVDGTTGDLLAGADSYSGGTIQSQRLGTGEYLLTISSPGAFTGKSGDDYSLQLQCHAPAFADEFAAGQIVILDTDTMTVEVYTADVEELGGGGVDRDTDFSVLVMDAVAAQVSGAAGSGSDLLIGKKQSRARMVGDGVYGSKQSIKVKARGSKKSKFFVLVENEGNTTRSISVGTRGKSKGLKPKYFLLSGGRVNVTSSVKTSGAVLSALAPGQGALFQGAAKFRSGTFKKSKISVQASDPATGQVHDTVEAKVKKKKL